MAAQARHEGLGQPVAERRLGVQALAPSAAPAQPGHLGRGAGLIDEDQPVRLLAQPRLAPGAPVLARLADVGALLFAGPQRFF